MKTKRTLCRILWGVMMAITIPVYELLVWWCKPFPFVAWRPVMLAVLLLAEFELFEGIDYFLSGRDFRKPKLCKRMNIVCGGFLIFGLLLMFINGLHPFMPDLIGLYFLMVIAFGLILIGHGLNCFFDSLNYFLHEEYKKWYQTVWNVSKMAAVVLIVLLITWRVLWALLQ